jgi:hypothetical protein
MDDQGGRNADLALLYLGVSAAARIGETRRHGRTAANIVVDRKREKKFRVSHSVIREYLTSYKEE